MLSGELIADTEARIRSASEGRSRPRREERAEEEGGMRSAAAVVVAGEEVVGFVVAESVGVVEAEEFWMLHLSRLDMLGSMVSCCCVW